MSMISKTRLEEFANGLWAKIQNKVGGSIIDIRYDATNKKFVVTKIDNSTVDINVQELIGVSDATFDRSTNLLTLAKGDGSSVTVDLSHLKTTWKNLEHVTAITFTNLIYGRPFKQGYYLDNGQYVANTYHRLYTIPCIPGKTYKRKNLLDFQNTTCTLRGGVNGDVHLKTIYWERCPDTTNCYQITIPEDTPNVTHFTFNCNVSFGQERELMVWDASEPTPQEYVENTKTYDIVVGDEVKFEFNPGATGLVSTTIDGAIMEIVGKINNSGTVKSVNSIQPDGRGNIQLAAGDVDAYTKAEAEGKFVLQTEVANEANKIPRLGADGKLETSILPKISINETFTVTATDQGDLEAQAVALTVENGDMIVGQVGSAPDVVTKKYLCIDATKTTFAEKFIELTFPTDGITEAELQAELAKYVLTSDTGTGANQVLRLDGEGKIDDTNLKIATSDEINAIINALQ